MSTVSIKDLDKAMVFAALFNNAEVDGKGRGLGMQMDAAEAAMILNASYSLDRIRSRPLFLNDLRTATDTLDTTKYDECYGTNRARFIIAQLRTSGSISRI